MLLSVASHTKPRKAWDRCIASEWDLTSPLLSNLDELICKFQHVIVAFLLSRRHADVYARYHTSLGDPPNRLTKPKEFSC